MYFVNNENIKDYIAVLFIKQGQVVLFFEFFLKFVTRRKYIDVLKYFAVGSFFYFRENVHEKIYFLLCVKCTIKFFHYSIVLDVALRYYAQ